MSFKGAEILNTLDELITSNPDFQNPNITKALNYLNIQNNFHNKMICSIKANMAKEIANGNQQEENNIDSSIFREKIKYKSKLKTENLNKIINLEIFNNIPSNKSLELLNNFQNKANNVLNKSKRIQEDENNNNNPLINNESKDDRANINSFFDRKNKIKSNFNANKSQDKISYGGGSYMDIRPVNGKKKKYNNSNDDDNDDDESENKNGYSAYANSIYNINKKKKNKRKRYNKDDDEENEEEENTYNNKKRTYNNKKRNWKNNKYDEQDDEDEENNIQNNALPPAGGGFVSAITITNAVFKNKISNSYVEMPADNPIWATYDILHGCRKLYNINSRTNEYVVAGYPHAAMDAYWEEWKAAADYADEMVVNNDGELEPRFRFDAFYDSAMKRWDAAQKAATVGHASIIMHGRNIGIVVDRPGTMTQIFGEGRTTVSSVKGSFSSTEDRARAIEVTYSDEHNDFKNTMMTIRSLDYAESRSSDNTAQLQLFGVKRRSQAYREAVHALATNERQLQFIELGADIDAVVAEYGDIVGYNHAVSRVGIASGRIISCNGNTVVLDHDVTLEPEKMYELYIQLPDDTLIRRDVIPGNETTNEIIVAEPFVSPQMPQRFDNYAFGELNKAVKPFRVVSAQRDGDMRVTLKLAEYDEAIYSDDLDYSKFPVIDYSSSPITGNIIESLTATEETYTTNEGALTSNIIINWSLSRDANYVPDSYRVTVVNTTTGFSEEFNTRATTQYVRGVSPKAMYTVTVRCIFDAVVVGSVSTELYITGKDEPPPDVTGLKCKQTAGGFLLSWDSIEIKDLRGFTIWQGVDGVGIDGCNKINDCYGGTSLFVPVTEAENYILSIIAEYILPDDITDFIGVRNGETITFSWDAQDGMSYELRWGTSWDTAHIVVKLKSNMYMYFFPQLGTQTFCVKAIDEYGNYSQNPAYVSIDLTDGVNRNVIAVFDDQHDGWQGVKNNVHVMDGRLVLDDNVTGGEYIAEITLPEAIPARNWIQYHAGTVASDVVWSDMLYPWNEVSGAWYPEGDLGSGKVEHYISTYTGLSNTTVDAISLNNTTDSDKGSAVVSESQGIAYENGRFAKGARISDIASLAYTVSIPAVFHLAFNAKHTTAINNHIIYMTLVGSGRWLRLGYNNGTFYLLDSNGRRITVNISPHADDIISFTIDQTTDNRSLTVECLAMNTTRTVSAEYEPLGTFTGFKLE